MGRQKHMIIESETTERQLPKTRYRLWYDRRRPVLREMHIQQ